MPLILLLVHTGVTLALVGLIWFVQVVHYPLFARVGKTAFTAYEAQHVSRTGAVVLPLMLTELLSAIAIAIRAPAGVGFEFPLAGLALVVVIWASTFLLQVPCHRVLEEGFDAHAHAQLVRTNWVRTVAWTARGALVLAMVALAT